MRNTDSNDTALHKFLRDKVSQRTLSRDLKAELLAKMPRSKTITVWSTRGDYESDIFAQEIYSFLANNGFRLPVGAPFPRIGIGAAVGIKMHEEESSWHLRIGTAGSSETIIFR